MTTHIGEPVLLSSGEIAHRTECPDCSGNGSYEARLCGHAADCPCSGRETTCECCGGEGVIDEIDCGCADCEQMAADMDAQERKERERQESERYAALLEDYHAARRKGEAA
jgi:hypothetical protein